MGLIHDTDGVVGIETRRESFRVYDEGTEDSIAAYSDDCVEISYEFFNELLDTLAGLDTTRTMPIELLQIIRRLRR